MTDVLHPAKYSKALMPFFQSIIDSYGYDSDDPIDVLDPFAGTGRIHDLASLWVQTWGVEIEEPWADLHDRTMCGDSTQLHKWFPPLSFDMIITSPTYGNRFADHHVPRNEAKLWTRRGYTYDLRAMTGEPERQLEPNNTGKLMFSSPKYKKLHQEVYAQCHRVLRQGGWFVLNVSDSIFKGEIVPVAAWHRDVLIELGLRVIAEYDVPTPRLRMGRNESARVECEKIFVLEKPV